MFSPNALLVDFTGTLMLLLADETTAVQNRVHNRSCQICRHRHERDIVKFLMLCVILDFKKKVFFLPTNKKYILHFKTYVFKNGN